MALECVVTMEVERDGQKRQFKGGHESKDWEALESGLKRDGHKILSHRREFVEREEIRDAVELKQ